MLDEFYYAEDYHQQYLSKNPWGYCGLKGTGVSCPLPPKKWFWKLIKPASQLKYSLYSTLINWYWPCSLIINSSSKILVNFFLIPDNIRMRSVLSRPIASLRNSLRRGGEWHAPTPEQMRGAQNNWLYMHFFSERGWFPAEVLSRCISLPYQF